jgi:hypothetical protein
MKMAVTPELLFKSFLAGLALVFTTRGLLLLLFTIVVSVLGILLRARALSHLALILILLVFVLNLHVFAIFPVDSTARNIMSIAGGSASLTNRTLEIFAKSLYNLGILILPLLIYLISISIIGRPASEDR